MIPLSRRVRGPRFGVTTIMSEQTARRLSWSIVALSIVVVLTGLVLSILAPVAGGQGVPFSHQFFTPIGTLTYGVVGALVASRHPRNPIGWLFCAIGLLSAVNMFGAGYVLYDHLAVKDAFLPGVDLAWWLTTWLWLPTLLLPITFVLLLFPTGHLSSRRWRPIAWAAGLGAIALTFATAFRPGPLEAVRGQTEPNPLGIPGSADVLNALLAVGASLLLIGVLGSIASVVVRFRNATGVERAQLKWLVFSGMIVIAGNILGGIPLAVWPHNPAANEFTILLTSATVISIVLATGIAILRHRLWDIDILINRTLVYFSLTALIVGAYVAIVGALGTVLQTGASLLVSFVATGIVAVSFQPLRQRVQQGVNRLMFGDRDDPYAVLGRLSERLEGVVTAQSVLPTIVEIVAEALKLPYAAIALKEGEDFRTAAAYTRPSAPWRTPDAEMKRLPLVYQLETMGQMLLAPRAPDEQFSKSDRRLLETIARQAGIAAYNVRLTQDLQRSRERLVTTREEERRRLRRDLHDGLGPALASLSFKLEAVHNLADRDPTAVKRLAVELKTHLQGSLEDIRRIAYGLRPPALDELGLVGALREQVVSHNQAPGAHITLEVPERLPAFSAAVEVAAYRIAIEAMTNVKRHAHAQDCAVRFTLGDDLCLEVVDDGRGIPSNVRAGVGMASMRERAEELGGTCAVAAIPAGGTSVRVRLPLLVEDGAK
jgi:signal transduction histidine kinase